MASKSKVNANSIDWSSPGCDRATGNKYKAGVFRPDHDFDSYHATYGYNTWDYVPRELEGRLTLRQTIGTPAVSLVTPGNAHQKEEN